MSEPVSVYPGGKTLAGLVRQCRTILRPISGTDFALFCLFASIAFQYDVVRTPLQMALAEPVGWAAIIYLLVSEGAWSGIRGATAKVVCGLLGFLGFWVLVAWLVNPTWRYELDELRWIFLAVAVLVTLLGTVRDWRRALTIYLVVAALAAAIADFQGLTGAFAPPFSSSVAKGLGFPGEQEQAVRVAVGFFRNSNMFGGFVFWPLLICVGLVLDPRYRLEGGLGVAFFAASLYLSVSRGVEAGFLLAIMLFLLSSVSLPSKWLRLVIPVLVGGFLAGGVLVVAISPRDLQPQQVGFFTTLWLRVELWKASLQYFQHFPRTLLLGAGSGLKVPPLASWAESLAPSDPHDFYLYATMHYGIPGLLALLGVCGAAVALGWQRYKRGALNRDSLLRALWAAWMAFPVMAILDSYFNTAEWDLILLVALAFWLQLGAGDPRVDHQFHLPWSKAGTS